MAVTVVPDLSQLDQLVGELVVEEELARTPRAVVFRVRTGALGRPLALKVALVPSDAEELARFQHEVRLLSEARHPNVVEVYDFGVLAGDHPFLTMELLARESLAARLARGSAEGIWDLAIQAAAGLAHIHRQGVIHMDIKPGNLGLAADRPEGTIALKILDFGLAQAAYGPLDRRIRGTLAYSAPEVLLQDRYDHRADLYSLGMTLFELATGTLPSAGGDLAALRFHLEGQPPDPATLRPDLPPALAGILLRLLRRDPAERYPSASRLLEELCRACGRELTAGPAPAGTLLASRLIGRREILDHLREALRGAREGRGAALVLEGPEGAGKSRLLREFRLLAAIDGARVGRGRGLAERPSALGPVLQALSSVGIEPKCGPLNSLAEADPHARFRIYGTVAQSLAEQSVGSPLVLLLDDLHLAGQGSEELLAFLAEELSTLPVLVVACRRPGLGTAGEVEGVQLLALPPLDRNDTEQLVDACLGTAGLHPSFYGWVFERCEGIAGEALRLLRRLVDDAVLVCRDGEWKPSLTALSRTVQGRPALEALEWQRVGTLAQPVRAVLDAAAVLSEPSSLDTFSAVVGEPAQPVYERLQQLVAAGLVDRLHEASGTLYAVAEPRLEQALYAEIDGGRRSRLHRLAGEALARQGYGAATPAVTAEHFWRGGEPSQALPFLVESAGQAQAIYAFSDAAVAWGRVAEALAESAPQEAARALYSQAEATAAAGEYGRALQLCTALAAGCSAPAEPEELRPLHARACWLKGRLHTRLGEHEAALESHATGLAALALHDDPALSIDLRHAQAIALRDLGDWSAAFTTARAALGEAGRRGLDRQRALLLSSLGMLYFSRGDWRRAGRLVRRAVAVAARTGQDDLAVALRNNLGTILWKTGDFDAALEHYRENLAVCRRTNDLWGEIFALNNLGILEASRGNWRAAGEPLARSLDLKRRLGLRENEAVARLNLGEVEEVLGNWHRAQRHYERALKLLADTPEHRERLAALAQLASLARKRGRIEEAERLAREALAAAERGGDRDLVAQCHLQLGLLERDGDNLEGAGLQLRQALTLAEAAGTRQLLARIRLALADLSLRRGDLDEAEKQSTEARLLVSELGDRYGRAKLLSQEARSAFARNRVDQAERLFADAVRLLAELEAPLEHARSLYEWGLRTWSSDAALSRLGRALAEFERLGAQAEAVRARGAISRVRESRQTAANVSAVLYEVGKVINSSLDLKEVLDRTMDLVLERLGAERGMIVLTNRITHDLEIATVRNVGRNDEQEGRKLSESVVKRVIETKEPVLAVDAQTDGRFAGVESIVASHILSILCVPLSIRDRPAGAIYIDHRRSRHLFGPGEVELLVAFADQAAIAIENARLYGEIAAARERLKEENESLRSEILSRQGLGSLIGRSRPIAELKTVLEKVAQSPSTVLIRGESGTGKGLVARIIHAISPRRQAPFVHFNCAALPETLVESELFGHEKGAFTGAAGQKPGRFELASHGTIFLDEVGKVSRSVQAKLLRVVEEKEFERVGGTRTLRADVRVIAASNIDLEEAVRRQEFLEDLYYRLNIIPIELPPLRHRREDIPYLTEHFLTKICRDLGRPLKELEPAVLDLFDAHAWPGNIRELEAAIHRAVVLSGEGPLAAADFGWIDLAVRGQAPAPRHTAPDEDAPTIELGSGGYEAALESFDRRLIAVALEKSKGKIRETARLLGIARNTLRAKMKKYDMVSSRE